MGVRPAGRRRQLAVGCSIRSTCSLPVRLLPLAILCFSELHSEFLTHCQNGSICLGLENVTEVSPPNVFIHYIIGEGRYLTRAEGTTIFPSTAWPCGQCKTLVEDRAVPARAPFTHFLRRSAPTSPLALPSLGRFFLPSLLALLNYGFGYVGGHFLHGVDPLYAPAEEVKLHVQRCLLSPTSPRRPYHGTSWTLHLSRSWWCASDSAGVGR